MTSKMVNASNSMEKNDCILSLEGIVLILHGNATASTWLCAYYHDQI